MEVFPPLLCHASPADRDKWARWVLGSHSDQFLPEMLRAVELLDAQQPIAYGTPHLNPAPLPADLLVVTSERGRHSFVVDSLLPVRVVLLDVTGSGFESGANPLAWEQVSVQCEGMGDVLDFVWRYLMPDQPDTYIGVLCDDVMVRSSDIHRLLSMARLHGLTAVQPSVAHNHELSVEYGFLRQRPCVTMHRVPMVEVMAPIIRRDLFDLALSFNRGTRSAYGLDRFALPLCAFHLGEWRFASIDLTPMSHIRRGRTIDRRYSNGLLSKEEELLVRYRLMVAMGCQVDLNRYRQLEAAVEGLLAGQTSAPQF
mgnify:FL=1